MSTITVDRDLLPLFQQLSEVTEVRDPQGALLGYFAPATQTNARLYARAFAMFDPAEIKRRKEQDAGHPGYTLEQVMQHLRSLEKNV